MPFQQGTRLPGEYSGKLNHLDVLNSELVKELIKQFEYPASPPTQHTTLEWVPFIDTSISPLRLIFAVDGSLQSVQSETVPFREVAFIKTALMRLDPQVIAGLDPEYPHPVEMKRMMEQSALYHSTVLPLKNVIVPGYRNLDAVRKIIYESIRNDPRMEGLPFETLQWLLHAKWANPALPSPDFSCPHCMKDVLGFPVDVDEMTCPHCGGHLYLTDVIGFHMEMLEDTASQGLASSYMLIHETLTLFSAIKYFWDHDKSCLVDALFIKDGPLNLRSQYSKIVPRIRAFFQHAKDHGYPVHLIGQEKSGVFFDHLSGLERFVPPLHRDDSPTYALLSHSYIREEIQRTPDLSNPYGLRTNYGEKIFVKMNPYHSMILNVPVGLYVHDVDFPSVMSDLIGFDRIMATLPSLLSHRYQGGLLPIELAHGVASLASYPSAKVLKVFAGLG